MSLNFFLNRKKAICVISLQGLLVDGAIPVLEDCLKGASAENSQYKILNLTGLTGFDLSQPRPFALFLQALRGDKKLFVCGIESKMLLKLRGHGLIRDDELQPDLMYALQAILTLENGKAPGKIK